ncbi:MAG: hypothetical protein FWG66_01175 [Spirochaetes bacterium]|nr:hypothetical protein [Spirochaetota bacterium]
MSYDKMNREIEKYLKQNNLPVSGKASDTEEETDRRLAAYAQGRDFVVDKWLEEKKYKELVSVVHGGWFGDEAVLVPLANYFVREKETEWLKFLCERKIRHLCEDTLSCLKAQQEVFPNKDQAFSDDQLEKTLAKTLEKIDRYIGFLEPANCPEYLERIRELKKKAESLTMKPNDLKIIKAKAPNN